MTNYLLLVAIVAFVLQSEVVSLLQSKFYQPFMLLYICHGTFILFLPGLQAYYYINKKLDIFDSQLLSAKKSLLELNSLNFWTRIMILNFAFTCSSLLWYSAVSKIPIGEITAIYNTSCFFTYIFSLYFLQEKFSFFKLGAVLLSIAGICSIALFDGYSNEKGFGSRGNHKLQNSEMFLGYAFAIMSSICAASYEILYTKLVIPKNPSISFSLYITGTMGAITVGCGIVLFPFFHFTGIEVFTIPPPEEFAQIFLIAILGLLFNSVFLLLITFSGPVLAATGILVSIPLTSLLDYFMVGTKIGWNIIAGSILIFIGFYFLQVSELWPSKECTLLPQDSPPPEFNPLLSEESDISEEVIY